jgi:hypothetical protein
VVLPLVHATVFSVYQHADDEAGVKEFLECPLPKLRAWHDHLIGTRRGWDSPTSAIL